MQKIIYILILTLIVLIVKAQNVTEYTNAEKLRLNTFAEEAKPVFSSDANTMYFVRAYHKGNMGYSKAKYNEDIWKAERKEDKWTLATNEKSINNEKNNSIIGQGKGKRFFLLNTYQDEKNLQYGIALVTKEVKKWSKPEIIPIPKLKYDGNFYDFFITKDEKVLLISIKGDNSKGEEDLYVTLKKDGKWSSPKNLGTMINTPGYEFAPFLSEDKKYLYYSTNGRNDGLGGADVYVSERLDDSWTNWSEPKNMGNVINSESMDCYFTINSKGESYFTSNRGGKDLNIYKAIEKIPEPIYSKDFTIKGIVRNSETNYPMSLDIIISDQNTKEIIKTIKSDENGVYKVKLEKGNKYVFNITEKKYHEHHDVLITPQLESKEVSLDHDILMKAYKKGDEIKLDALFFTVNTDLLRNISLPVIERLAQILKENEALKISIEGHTSSDGIKETNQKLSEQRAEKIKQLLIERGIVSNRLQTIGFGQTKPIISNDTDEQRKMNRRVEFIILN